MTTHALALLGLFCATLPAGDVQLSPRYRTVFVLPMTNALDQNLASHLTSSRVLRVVLDPASADVVFTDNLDEHFWNWLARSFPPQAAATDTPNRVAYRDRRWQIPSHAGTVFLVDPRRRLILWSTCDFPNDFSPSGINRSALRITNQLKSAFGKS